MRRNWHLPLRILDVDVSLMKDEATDDTAVAELDPLLLDPDLLSVMASFTTTGWYQIQAVGQGLGLPADAMARHVARLREAGCVDTRTSSDWVDWMQITRPGALRLAGHVVALQDTLTSTRRLARSMWPQ
jgi:hypothetical protein